MFFTRIIATAALAFGMLAVANPTKRDTSTAQVETILNELKGKTDTIIPQLKQLASTGQANNATVGPLIGQLTTALNTATSSLATVPPSHGLPLNPNDQEIANLIGGIIIEITDGLNPLNTASNAPFLLSLLDEVSVAVASILAALDDIVNDILLLLAGVLVNVGGLLASLGLGNIAALLGIL